MPAENPVHYHSQFMPLEVNAVIAEPEPMQGFPSPPEFAKTFEIGLHDFLREAAEYTDRSRPLPIEIATAQDPFGWRSALTFLFPRLARVLRVPPLVWAVELAYWPQPFGRFQVAMVRLPNVAWEAPADQVQKGSELVKQYDIHPRTACST